MAVLSWSYVIEPINPPTTGERVLTDVVVAPSDFLRNLTTGDLAQPLAIVRGVDAVIQRLCIRLAFFRGEWFLDQREGVPYLQSVFVKNPDLPLIEALFRRVARTTPGVTRVVSYAAALDTRTRRYTATMRVQVGSTVAVLTSVPFVLEDR